MKAASRMSSAVQVQLREVIADARGREVLAVGKLNSRGRVIHLSIAARGDDTSVPALKPYMEKGDVVIHNHPSGNLAPSEADLSVANRLGQQGIGFYIVDNEVDELYGVAEPVLLDELVPLDLERLTGVLEPGGSLSGQIDFEPREAQVAMLREVARGFNDGAFVAAEAGTGVGKSFAYLIPALSWVQQNKEKVVISTATINLQQQLMDKDLPLVQKILSDKPVKAVLVKGRANYLCLRRLVEAMEDDSLFREESDQLSRISEWAMTSDTGSRSDLPFLPDEEVWSGICSEADTCLSLRCSRRESCFFLKARREAGAAQILVVNHHLLFSDLALRMGGAGFDGTAVLPPFQRIIFDEAHNMEKSATSYFSEELNRFSLNRLLNRLYSRRRTQVRGVWVQLQKITSPGQDDERVPPLLEEIRKKVDLLETLAAALPGQELAFRLTPRVDRTVLAEALLNPMGELKLLLFQLVALLQKALERVDEEDQEEGVVYEGRMLLSRLMGASSLCETYAEWEEKPDKVFWISRERTRKGDGFLRFVITPLDISGVMAEAVFQPFETVVCTSATMSVRASFDYWMRQVGLSRLADREVRAFQFPSPFPYQERVLLQIPADAPEPSHPDYSGYLSRKVEEILLLSEGHGLVLFTSYTQLRQVYEDTAPALQAAGIPLLKQGDDDRARLLEEFKRVSSSVLFATSSFWEGIDTPGSSLQVVIICKLPFQVPSDPVIAARREALENRGGNAFVELFLPEAVMRLKQGFGRLMRRSSDRGAVIILDSRIVRKSYGTMFLDSLPPARRSIKGGVVLLEELERFLYP